MNSEPDTKSMFEQGVLDFEGKASKRFELFDLYFMFQLVSNKHAPERLLKKKCRPKWKQRT